jgi:hypothetical protein
MKKITLSSSLIFILCITLLTACGVDSIDQPSPPPAARPTGAVITLSTSVTGTIPGDTTINGYDVTITLPAGVTVKSTTAPPQTDSGVVISTGSVAGSAMTAVYSAATATIPGKVRILIADASGYYAGEFSKVNCDITAGYDLTSSDFQQPTFAASGLLHSHLGYPDDVITDTVDLTGELSLTETVNIH